MRSTTALSPARVVSKAAVTSENAVLETHVATRRWPGRDTLAEEGLRGRCSGLEADGAVPGHRHLHDAIAPVHEREGSCCERDAELPVAAQVEVHAR